MRFVGLRLASGAYKRRPDDLFRVLAPDSARGVRAWSSPRRCSTTVGCLPDNHVGRPCEVGTTPLGGSSGQIVTVSSPALECPSRMCLLAGGNPTPQGTGALCTAGCESDVDCEGGRDRTEERPIGRPLRATVSRACGRRPWAPSRARSCAFAGTSSASPRVVSRSPRPAREHDCRSRHRRRARAPLDGDGRVTLDCYGRVGNMAPPFGLWQLIRSRRRGSREIPTGRHKESP